MEIQAASQESPLRTTVENIGCHSVESTKFGVYFLSAVLMPGKYQEGWHFRYFALLFRFDLGQTKVATVGSEEAIRQ
jgi:hypothetical protein